jgi:hypothetical protein
MMTFPPVRGATGTTLTFPVPLYPLPEPLATRTIGHQRQQSKVYTIKNRTDHERLLVLEHPYRPAFKLERVALDSYLAKLNVE